MKNSEILAEQELRDIYYDPSAGYQYTAFIVMQLCHYSYYAIVIF